MKAKRASPRPRTRAPLTAASYLAPALAPMYAALAAGAATRLGLDVAFTLERDYSLLEHRGRPDLVFLCGLPYVALADRARPAYTAVAAPVPSGARYRGLPIYYSDVVVAAGSPARSFADLRGARFGYNEVRSHSGYGVVVHHLAALQDAPEFFGEWVPVGFHQRAVDLVATGAIDAAAVDSHLLDVLTLRSPESTARLRVVEHLGPSPIQPAAVSTALGDDLRRDLAAALLAAARDPELRAVLEDSAVSAWVPAGDADYDPIRAMTARGRAGAAAAVRPHQRRPTSSPTAPVHRP